MTDNTARALAHIKAIYGTPEGEEPVTEYITHHLSEISPEEWKKALGTATPTPEQVLGSLVLVGNWSSNDDGVNDVFDFGLPDQLTDYVIAVRFDGDEIIDVEMES